MNLNVPLVFSASLFETIYKLDHFEEIYLIYLYHMIFFLYLHKRIILKQDPLKESYGKEPDTQNYVLTN